MCLEPAVSGITSGFDSAPPKGSGNCRHGTSAMLRITLLRSLAMVSRSLPAVSLRRRKIARHPALAEPRLVVGRRRQLPGAGRGRPHIGADMHDGEGRLFWFYPPPLP